MRILAGAAACVSALLLAACGVQPAKPFTYVAIGASDAVGVGVRDPDTDGWVPRFGARLGSNVHVVNLGVSGSTLAQALNEQVPPALDARPDVITVWLAVNDLNGHVPLERYAANLDAMLGQLQQTRARVLVGNLPDLTALAAFQGADPELLRAEVDRWNAVISDAVQRHGATLVDLHSYWREIADHPEYLSADGFHPSVEGYQRLADVFAGAL